MLSRPSGCYRNAREQDSTGVARISIAPRCDSVSNFDVIANVFDLCFCKSRSCFYAELSDGSSCTLKIEEDLHQSHKSRLMIQSTYSFHQCQTMQRLYQDKEHGPAFCLTSSCSPPHLSALSLQDCHPCKFRRYHTVLDSFIYSVGQLGIRAS